MKTTGIFTPYTPTNQKQLEAAAAIKAFSDMDVIFLQSQEGDDWYEACEEFSPDTMKIQFDADGIIRMFSCNAAALNPVNCAVAEVALSDVPDGLNERGEWAYYDGQIQPYQPTPDELQEIAQKLKRQLLAEAGEKIAILQDAVDLGMATEDEKFQLIDWKKYRVLLMRVEPDKQKWPDKPV